MMTFNIYNIIRTEKQRACYSTGTDMVNIE